MTWPRPSRFSLCSGSVRKAMKRNKTAGLRFPVMEEFYWRRSIPVSVS